MPPVISIIKEKKELYIKIHHSNKDIIETNYRFIKTLKKELVETFWSKKEAFCMKKTICKSEKGPKYALLNFYIKTDQRFNLVIINLKLVKKLGLKVRPINIFANYSFSIFIRNGDSI